jgi:hypothetical protein
MAVNNLASPFEACLKMQNALDGTKNAPGNIQEIRGMLGALNSPQNLTDSPIIDMGTLRGKGKPTASGTGVDLYVDYVAPQCDAVATSLNGLCGDQTDRGDDRKSIDIVVDQIAAKSGEFTEAEFDTLCDTPNARQLRLIRKDAKDILNGMNKKLVELAYNQVGTYADGTTNSQTAPKTINILNGAGHVNPAATGTIANEHFMMHDGDAPIVVGGNIFNAARLTRQSGGLGANAIGANANAPQPVVEYTDSHIDAVIQGLATTTDNYALSWSSGAMQIVEWFNYEGYKEKLHAPHYLKTTINIDGHKFDYTLRYDECNDKWQWELSKNYTLFYIPTAAYGSCMNGNRKLLWKLACGDFACGQYSF